MSFRLRVLVAILALVIPSTVRAAVGVGYSGTVYSDNGGLLVPAPGSYVIAGTFAPGYDWSNYKCDYGSDEVCNMNDNGFERAVSDGILFPIGLPDGLPIGPGFLTDVNGQFSGSGVTSAAAGTQIFLFAFNGPNSDGSIQSVAFSSSTDPSFFVPAAGTTILDSSLANVHILSAAYLGSGLVLSGGLPVPEPATAVLGMLFVLSISGVRSRCLLSI